MAQGERRSGVKNVEAIHGLTPTQEGILYHVVQAEAGAGPRDVYVQQYTCRLAESVDVERLALAWRAVITRHAALRSQFTWEGRPHPLQVVRSEVEFDLELAPDVDADAWTSFLADDRARGIDIRRAPGIRVTLAGRGPYWLVWTFHHLALDGWSMRIVLDDLARAFGGDALAEPPRTHGDFVAWRSRLPVQPQRAFWEAQLAGFDTPTRVAGSAPEGRGRSRERTLRLEADALAALEARARSEGVTLAALLRAVWALVLASRSGDADVVFGTTVAGRSSDLAGIDGIVGMLVSTLPARVRVDADGNLGELLRRVHGDQLASVEHEGAALNDIQRWSEVPAGTALFDTLLVVENHPPRATGAPLTFEDERFVERSHYPLAALAVPGNGLEWQLLHDDVRFPRDVVDAVERDLERICRALPSAASIGDLLDAPAPPASRAPVTVEPPSVLEAFLAARAAAPTSTALLAADGTQLSYADLAERAGRFAAALRENGVGRGDVVGVLLPRGVDAIAAILGTLALGAAYTPLDPNAPSARTRTMLEAAGVRCIVAFGSIDGAGRPGLDPAAIADRAPLGVEDWASPSGADTAYVLFTSGSTGEPKGVVVSHRALALSTLARDAVYGDPPERFLLLSPLHFDSSVAGLYWTLTRGGALALPASDEERDATRIAGWISEQRITHTLVLPSLWDVVLESAAPSELRSLQVVAVAGEACPASLVLRQHELLPRTDLFNEYGPTEATVWATAARLDSAPAPIGEPVGPVRVVVVGRHGALVPDGVPGELWIAGPTLANGYSRDPARTAERFVEHDFDGGGAARYYRTGDLVRRGARGLEFLGRADDQVKIRGHRVEPGEVEAALVALPSVREAVVVAAPTGARGALQLTAYLTAAGGALELDALRAEAASRLSAVMVPSHFIALDALPRTTTGKIDRRALPSPESAAPDADHVNARSDVEEQLAGLWRDVLGLERVSAEADFFELGGDSLASIRIIARAHKLGLSVDPARFADRPTIAGMALAARAATESRRGPSAPAPGEWLPLTPIQRWFFELDLPDRSHWNQAVRWELPPDATMEHVRGALDALVARHDALRLVFERRTGEWQQKVAAASAPRLDRFDGAAGELEGAALEVQQSIDLARGPLAAGLFIEDPSAPQLLLAVHHLAVDAVSWDTLEDDLAEALAGRTLSVDNVGFAAWPAALAAFAAQPGSTRWVAEARASTPPLPRDQDGANDVAAEGTVELRLDAASVDRALSEAERAYSMRPQETLLVALGRALSAWSGVSAHAVDVEGHGRAPELSPLDVSRTVGWFTSVRPVALETTADLGADLKRSKETVRAVPAGGAAYGALRAFAPEGLPETPRPEVAFNFLGRRSAQGSGRLKRIEGPTDGLAARTARARTGTRPYVIELNAWLDAADGALVLRWSYARTLLEQATIQALGRGVFAALDDIALHCAAPESGGATPSDFPLAGLDQAELDRLKNILGD